MVFMCSVNAEIRASEVCNKLMEILKLDLNFIPFQLHETALSPHSCVYATGAPLQTRGEEEEEKPSSRFSCAEGGGGERRERSVLPHINEEKSIFFSKVHFFSSRK